MKVYKHLALLSAVLALIFLASVESIWQRNSSSSLWEVDVRMPGVQPKKADAYFCTSYMLPETEAYVVKFEPIANQSTVHHLLVYSCGQPASPQQFWDCGSMVGTCSGYDDQQIIYAWARNAPPLRLPGGVGFQVSGSTGRRFLVLQLHYAHPFPDNSGDHSGIRLILSSQRQRFLAGIYLLGAWQPKIPAETKGVHVDIACQYESEVQMNAFAYRTHTHELGRVVSAYRVRGGVWTLLGKGNPQAPQAFYPMDDIITLQYGDYIVGRCTYDSAGRTKLTSMGPTSSDEMCNYYIMYFTLSSHVLEYDQECWDVEKKARAILVNIPPGSDTPVPLPPGMEGHHHHHHHHEGMTEHGHGHDLNEEATELSPGDITSGNGQDSSENTTESTPVPEHRATTPRPEQPGLKVVPNWPSADVSEGLGQVSAVALNSQGHVVIFHRADRIWGPVTFVKGHLLNDVERKRPISEPTVLTIHSQTGQILSKWGQNIFYLPHGLTIDSQDNLWITDVGMHQVFKFSGSDRSLELSLGEKLVPGSDKEHFCQPTSVAVDSGSGDFFVADGYCNSRILKFQKDGTYVMEWGKPSSYVRGFEAPPPGSFQIPHKLSLDQPLGRLFVADRENNRIQCFDSLTGDFLQQVELTQFGGRLFAVDFNQKGKVLYAVNGPSVRLDIQVVVQGFTINATNGALIQTWAPINQSFKQPHDVISSPDNTAVYVVEIGPNHVWKFTSGENKDPVTTIPATEPTTTKAPEVPTNENKSMEIHFDERMIEEVSVAFDGEESPISPVPAIVITAILLLPLIFLLIAAIVRKVRSRRRILLTRVNDIPLKSSNSGSCLGCCPTYYSFDKLQVDSDSDIDV